MINMPLELIADGLLIATALSAGVYCLVLSRRLRRLAEAGGGIGAQLEALDRTLEETRTRLAEMRSAVPELARGNEHAARLSAELAEAVLKGESLLQRLYQAEQRIERAAAREAGLDDGAADAGADQSRAPAASDSAEVGLEEGGRRVVLPEGQVLEETVVHAVPGRRRSGPEENTATADGEAGESGGAVLRAGRILL